MRCFYKSFSKTHLFLTRFCEDLLFVLNIFQKPTLEPQFIGIYESMFGDLLQLLDQANLEVARCFTSWWFNPLEKY